MLDQIFYVAKSPLSLTNYDPALPVWIGADDKKYQTLLWSHIAIKNGFLGSCFYWVQGANESMVFLVVYVFSFK
jgi:hypothetical protein